MKVIFESEDLAQATPSEVAMLVTLAQKLSVRLTKNDLSALTAMVEKHMPPAKSRPPQMRIGEKQSSKPKPAPPSADRAKVVELGEKLVEAGKGAALWAFLRDSYGAQRFSDIEDAELGTVYQKMKEIDQEDFVG